MPSAPRVHYLHIFLNFQSHGGLVQRVRLSIRANYAFITAPPIPLLPTLAIFRGCYQSGFYAIPFSFPTPQKSYSVVCLYLFCRPRSSSASTWSPRGCVDTSSHHPAYVLQWRIILCELQTYTNRYLHGRTAQESRSISRSSFGLNTHHHPIVVVVYETKEIILSFV